MYTLMVINIITSLWGNHRSIELTPANPIYTHVTLTQCEIGKDILQRATEGVKFSCVEDK